jgi:hypothetical protein
MLVGANTLAKIRKRPKPVNRHSDSCLELKRIKAI